MRRTLDGGTYIIANHVQACYGDGDLASNDGAGVLIIDDGDDELENSADD